MDISNVPCSAKWFPAKGDRQEHLQLNFSCFDEAVEQESTELEVQNEMKMTFTHSQRVEGN